MNNTCLHTLALIYIASRLSSLMYSSCSMPRPGLSQTTFYQVPGTWYQYIVCTPQVITWVVSASKSGNRSPSRSATGWEDVAILEHGEDATAAAVGGLLLMGCRARREREVLRSAADAVELRQARVVTTNMTKDYEIKSTRSHPLTDHCPAKKAVSFASDRMLFILY